MVVALPRRARSLDSARRRVPVRRRRRVPGSPPLQRARLVRPSCRPRGGSPGIGQNIWNFVNSNVGAQLVKGVGGGLMAGAQQNAQYERSDEERERQAASMNVKHNPLGRIDFQQAGGRILARMSEG